MTVENGTKVLTIGDLMAGRAKVQAETPAKGQKGRKADIGSIKLNNDNTCDIHVLLPLNEDGSAKIEMAADLVLKEGQKRRKTDKLCKINTNIMVAGVKLFVQLYLGMN